MDHIKRYLNENGVRVYKAYNNKRTFKNAAARAMYLAHKIVKECKRSYRIVSLSEALKRAWNEVKGFVIGSGAVAAYCFTSGNPLKGTEKIHRVHVEL